MGNVIATNKKNKRFTPKDNFTTRRFLNLNMLKEEHFFVPKFHWYSAGSGYQKGILLSHILVPKMRLASVKKHTMPTGKKHTKKRIKQKKML